MNLTFSMIIIYELHLRVDGRFSIMAFSPTGSSNKRVGGFVSLRCHLGGQAFLAAIGEEFCTEFADTYMNSTSKGDDVFVNSFTLKSQHGVGIHRMSHAAQQSDSRALDSTAQQQVCSSPHTFP